MPYARVRLGRVGILVVIATTTLVVWSPVGRELLHGLGLLATGQLAGFQQEMRALDGWAIAMSIVLMVLVSLIVPVPATILMVANGLAFGLWRGMLVSFVGGLLGAVIAYAIGRHLGRRVLCCLVPASSLDAADRMMRKYGNWAVLIGRWIPGVPIDPVSYAAGLTRMAVLPFVLLTIIGLAPANLAAAGLGTRIVGNVPVTYWLAGVSAAILLCLAWSRLRRPRRRTSPASTACSGT